MNIKELAKCQNIEKMATEMLRPQNLILQHNMSTHSMWQYVSNRNYHFADEQFRVVAHLLLICFITCEMHSSFSINSVDP